LGEKVNKKDIKDVVLSDCYFCRKFFDTDDLNVVEMRSSPSSHNNSVYICDDCLKKLNEGKLKIKN